MDRNSHNLGSSTRFRGKIPRWCSLFIGLVLASTIVSASQTRLVQAAPASEPVRVYMDVVGPKTTVCVGKQVSYEARVYTKPTSVVGNVAGTTTETRVESYAVPGIKVEAFSQDRSVGDVTPRFVSTGGPDNELIVSLTDPDAEPGPHSATFGFKAKKVGKTTLHFEAIALGQYTSFEVPVRVIHCKYKVIIGSRMHWAGVGGSVDYYGVSVDGLVTTDDTGYTFTSTEPANMFWVSSSRVPNCSAANTMTLGKVQIKGNLFDNQLKLNLEFDTVGFSDVVTCPGGQGSGTEQLKADSLSVIVPSSGGVVRQSQRLVAGSGTALGDANVYVIPLEGDK